MLLIIFVQYYKFWQTLFTNTAECGIVFSLMRSKKIFGFVAQLGERRVRNAEVEGSSPFGSTI